MSPEIEELDKSDKLENVYAKASEITSERSRTQSKRKMKTATKKPMMKTKINKLMMTTVRCLKWPYFAIFVVIILKP